MGEPKINSQQAPREAMKHLLNFLRALCAILVFVGLVLCVGAQESKPAGTPTADQIVEHYIAATGGRTAIQKQTSRASIGTIDAPAMKLSGTVMIHEKAPDKVLQVVIFSGNAFRQGFDGTTGWTDDPADGLRMLSGAELDEVRRDADFYHALHLREIYPTLRFTGTEKLDVMRTCLKGPQQARAWRTRCISTRRAASSPVLLVTDTPRTVIQKCRKIFRISAPLTVFSYLLRSLKREGARILR
jgi:hypothetical protein